MDIWGIYENRVNTYGKNKHASEYKREAYMLTKRLKESLSYHPALINGCAQEIAVINCDNLNEKFVFSLPEEDIELGSLVYWMDNYWLVSERDANATIYTKCKMIQCNYLLKWVSKDGVIHEQWCIIEDGTKYLTGELEDKNFVVTRGDSRIAMTIQKNEDTVLFDRECRFLIDDKDSPHKLAYILSKPLKSGQTYNNKGTFKFVLQEVTATKYDNHILGIADYYKYFTKENKENENSSTNKPNNGGFTTPTDKTKDNGGWL